MLSDKPVVMTCCNTRYAEIAETLDHECPVAPAAASTAPLTPFQRIEKIVRQQFAGLLTAEEAEFEHYLVLVGCTPAKAG